MKGDIYTKSSGARGATGEAIIKCAVSKLDHFLPQAIQPTVSLAARVLMGRIDGVTPRLLQNGISEFLFSCDIMTSSEL